MKRHNEPNLFKSLLLATVAALGLNASEVSATPTTGVTIVESEKDKIAIGVIEKIVLSVDTTVTVTDATTAGAHGSKKLVDFDIGGVVVLAAHCNLAVSESGSISATGPIVCGVGSAAVGTDNATLTSTEQNIIPSTSVSLTSSAGTFAAMSTGAAYLDGHSAAAAAYLNMAVADANNTDGQNDTVTVTGTVTLYVLHLGDFA